MYITVYTEEQRWVTADCLSETKEKHKVMTVIYWKHASIEFYTKQKYNSNKMIKLNLKAFA